MSLKIHSALAVLSLATLTPILLAYSPQALAQSQEVEIGCVTSEELPYLMPPANYPQLGTIPWDPVARDVLKLGQQTGKLRIKDIDRDTLVAYFEPKEFSKWHGNDFKMQALYQQALAKAKIARDQAPLDKPFTVSTTLLFCSHYDFAHHQFALHLIPHYDTSVQAFSGDNTQDPDPAVLVGWPLGVYQVRFTNPGLVDGLPMSEAQADAFVTKRTASDGTVDTRVKGVFTFVITGYDDDPIQGAVGAGDLMGRLLSVTIYDNNGAILHRYVAQ